MAFDNVRKNSKKTKTNNHETLVYAGRHINMENLEKLDPVDNGTLYFQYICNAMPTKSSLKYIYKFVKNYNPEIFPNLKIEEMKVLGNMLDEMAFRENAHKNILKILKELILKIQTSPHHLTFLHPIFAKHCLLAKTYSYARDILANDIEDFDTNVNVLDFLLYHYYGGMLAIGLKDFNKALIYFRRVISAPTNKTASFIMVESYKKYVLISILLHGRKQPLTYYTDDTVTKILRNSVSCKKYMELETAFTFSSSETFVNIKRIRKLSNFHSKNNEGLMKQCTRSYIRQVIQKLTQTYITMSFQEIAKEIDLDYNDENAKKMVETHLLSMIENNEIFAYINHNNGGMVSFYDDPERYDSNETMEKINDCINTIAQLNDKVLEYNRDIKREHIIERTKDMKEIKKNIDKKVLNPMEEGSHDLSFIYNNDYPSNMPIDDFMNPEFESSDEDHDNDMKYFMNNH
jgi:COP9 signalosome complex subunit 3